MSVLVSDDEYKRIYGFMRENIDAIPRQVIDDAIAEIQRKANSSQWSEATVYGLNKAISIIKKRIAEVDNANH